MFHEHDLDIQKELSAIPPEFQDIFRQALEQELADQEQDRTDTEILRYLRQRRDDFRRGAFIRPDGRPGIITADVETLYEQGAFDAASGRDDEEAARERRWVQLKLAGLLLLAALFLIFAFRGRAARTAGEAEAPPAAVAAVTTTPALPDIGGAGDTLQTIGGLGASLPIGRPSALELHYSRTEETIALAIDPSQTTPRGELRYNAATMASENPVAVWLFGTVVNYGIGLPDTLVRNLQAGDRLTLSTDTGAALAFVVSETRTASSHETAAVLSQNRPGMTLFALPAAADDDVALAFAIYDVASEGRRRQVLYEIGDGVPLAGWGEVKIEGVAYEHTRDGFLRIVVTGENKPQRAADAGDLLLSLTTPGDQTPAVPLQAAAGGTWTATFTLSEGRAGLPLYAELRALPGGGLAVVRLGDLPDLLQQLELSPPQAHLSEDGRQVEVQVDVSNPEEGAVYLYSGFIRLKGGEADAALGQALPALPTLIAPGETRALRFVFPLAATTAEDGSVPAGNDVEQIIQMQTGADLWQITVPPGHARP